ncbi:MAG: macro domain-containing protein [Lachnospiraceae bacterium]|nr:macro domain-containing protein [Lachnospiraceae bacterium]
MAFRIIRNDITKVSADAIVNTANPEPVYSRGTDSAIYMAAGESELLEERKKIGDMEPGQAAYTPAFKLDARYIIHTVSPVWEGGEYGEKDVLKSCYVNSLSVADEIGCESIAFPLLATGSYGFPKADALNIAISAFSEFLAEHDMQILLVVFDKESFDLSDKIFTGVDAYIDEKYVSVHEDIEYGDAPFMGAAPAMSAPCFEYESTPVQASSSVSATGPSEITGKNRTRERKLFGNAGKVFHSVSDKKSARTLDEVMENVAETWQESLFRLIDEKGYTDTEVYKRANVDRKLFSKIRSNVSYQPKKITAVSFALALKLSLDETKDMLGRAGYALSPSSRFDLIIEYFIENEVYDTYTINLALFEHEQPLLGE